MSKIYHYTCEARYSRPAHKDGYAQSICKTCEKFNFMKKGKMIISVKIQNFSRSRMTKQTSPLESSLEI